MVKDKIKSMHIGQVLYLGRWVDKKSFRTFVFDKKGEQKLAESYKEYEDLIATGLWFSEKKNPMDDPKARKQKDVVCPAS